MNIKKILVGTAAGALMFGSLAASAFASTETVYNALPSVSPHTNYPSQPFQAQQAFEFGDYIHLGGTNRALNTVTVTMSDWAKYSDYSGDSRYSGNSSTWTHPITLNVYTNHLDSNGAPDDKIATVTQDITIPWRPESDPSCGSTSNGMGWKEGNTCFNYSGIAFNAVFDLSSLNVTLPDDIIVSVAYNTQTWGYSPIGTAGPYNSLNVAVPSGNSATVGSDDSNDKVFWNTHTCAWYTDATSKATCTSGTFGLFQDTGWTPYGTVALQVAASSALVGPPTNKDQCKNNGWKVFNNPTFKNQGDCVSYVQSNPRAVGNKK